MKKFIVLWAAISLTASLFAVPVSLGGWIIGDPGTTHQVWDFTQGYVTPVTGDGYSATPEIVDNPMPLEVTANIAPGSTWDEETAFVSETYISVNLEIPNFYELNPYKEIWVDLGDNVVNLNDVSVTATPTNVDFDIMVVPGQGDAEFGVKIWPNPYVEKIGFILWGSQAAPVVLDYIQVDTICIPEPATLALLGLGGLLLRKRK